MKSRIPLAVVLAALGLAGTALAQPPGRPGGPPFGGPGNLERIIDNLRLDDKQDAAARKAIDAQDDQVRRARDQARTELLARMKDVLSAEQFKQFREAADRRPGPGGPGGGGVPTDDLVRHVMSFDKDGDGKVTREELPERMHRLIELGDTNGDGALDREELQQLAEKLRQANQQRARGPGGPGGRGGPGGPPGRGGAADLRPPPPHPETRAQTAKKRRKAP